MLDTDRPWEIPLPDHVYCPVCGQQPGVRLEVYTWKPIMRVHEHYPEGRPVKCPGSGRRPDE